MKASLSIRLQVCQCSGEKDLFHPWFFYYRLTQSKKTTVDKNRKKIPECV